MNKCIENKYKEMCENSQKKGPKMIRWGNMPLNPKSMLRMALNAK
jgi:hypothetical protein